MKVLSPENDTPAQITVSSSKEETRKESPLLAPPTRRYYYAVGRRKSSTAQVRLFPESGGMVTVNEKLLSKYFPWIELQEVVIAPLVITGLLQDFTVSARVLGGGVRGQTEAIRLGIARALLKYNPELRQALKPHGLLTRNSREKERKKPGLKRARRAPQWQKR